MNEGDPALIFVLYTPPQYVPQARFAFAPARTRAAAVWLDGRGRCLGPASAYPVPHVPASFMNPTEGSARPRLVHPLLLSLFPVLYLFSRNTDLLNVTDVLGLGLVLLVVGVVAWAGLGWLLGDSGKAALVVSLSVLFFFGYSSLHDLGAYLGIKWLQRDQILFPVVVVCYGGLLFGLLRTRRSLEALNQGVNVFAVVLVGLSLFNAIYFKWQDPTLAQNPLLEPADLAAPVQPVAEAPNIYYIIVDAYARQDVLQKRYGFDNADFIGFLEEQGFAVASDGFSHYSQTALSVASTLNMAYLNETFGSLDGVTTSMLGAAAMIKHNRLMHRLKGYGYHTIAFQTGYHLTEMYTADTVIESDDWFTGQALSDLLIHMTPIAGVFGNRLRKRFGHRWQRDRVLRIFNDLPETTAYPAPRFVFAHLVIPHPPYIFRADGTFDPPDGPFLLASPYDRASDPRYVEQLQFVNAQLRTTLTRLIAQDPEGIIVLQSDHGPGALEDETAADSVKVRHKMGILHAIRDPALPPAAAPPAPANLFRGVLNRHLQTDFSLLPERSYYSSYTRPFYFQDVTALMVP